MPSTRALSLSGLLSIARKRAVGVGARPWRRAAAASAASASATASASTIGTSMARVDTAQRSGPAGAPALLALLGGAVSDAVGAWDVEVHFRHLEPLEPS